MTGPMKLAIGIVTIAVLATAALAQPQPKPAGDCPLFLGQPFYSIVSATDEASGTHDFLAGPQRRTIAGAVCTREYESLSGQSSNGRRHIVDSYNAALRALIGMVQFNDACPQSVCPGNTGYHLLVGNAAVGIEEAWLEVKVNADGTRYTLTVLTHDLVSPFLTTTQLLDALKADGKASLGLAFEPGKAKLLPASLPAVEQVAKILQDDASLAFVVQGNTNELATAAENLQLSEQRAQAVVKSLMALGVPVSRLTPVGAGQTLPLAPNTNALYRTANQRTEFIKR